MIELEQFLTFLDADFILSIIKALLLLMTGYVGGRFVSAAVVRVIKSKANAHSQLIIKQGVFYFIFVLLTVSALRQLGFDLGILLGAAGILTVAVGFASQTSASNLISGLFLMLEKPFSVSDVVRVGTTTGEVISIDLLSVKLRTFDNLFVRIPNETMIKSEVTTLTKYPIRRIDLQLGVAYKEDLQKVKEILMDIAEKNPMSLEEPAPLFILQNFGASSIDIQFSLWAQRANLIQLKNDMLTAIKKTFDEQGIEIPYPHLSLYTGSVTAPLPITMVEAQGVKR